ncbi:MAG: hypothetical protein R3324_08525, partial [Halobacteriales archaeon]|nr:hypothetical protein [Halobacteriales archaeon]
TLDENGNPVVETIRGRRDIDGGEGVLSRVEVDYNEHDLPIVASRSMLGEGGNERTTRTFYNAYLAQWKIVDAMGGVTEYGYDDVGHLRLVEDPVGNTIATEYDEAGRRNEVVETDLEWRYDVSTGEWRRESRSYTTTFDHDPLGRLRSTTGPAGTVRYFYDSADRVRGSLDSEGGLLEMGYDGLGRRVGMTTDGVEQRMEYVPTGQLGEVEGPMSHRRWTYDRLGRLATTEDVLNGGITKIERDDLGNPETITDPNGTVVKREFDPVGLPTEIRVIERRAKGIVLEDGRRVPTLVATPFQETYEYDGLGRVLEAKTWASDQPETQVAFRYDGLGQIVHEEQTVGTIKQTLARSYAPDGSWSEVVYPELTGAPRLRSHYNTLGQVGRIDLDGEMLVSYLYDGSDRVSARSARNGVLTIYGYDRARRLDRVATRAPTAGSEPEVPTRFLAESRAAYEGGRIVGSRSRYVGDSRRPASAGATEISYDERGRPVATISWSGAPAGSEEGREGISVTASFTEYDGDFPQRMAEVHYRERAAPGGILQNLASLLFGNEQSRPLTESTIATVRIPTFARTIEYTLEEGGEA